MKIEVVRTHRTANGEWVIRVHHEEGQGYLSCSSTHTDIAEFPSKLAANRAVDLIGWWGDKRFTRGVRFARENYGEGK